MWFLLILGICIATVYITLTRNNSYWTKRGVSQVQPWPIFGNVGPPIMRLGSLTDVLQDIYSSFPEDRYCGIYNFLKPTLLIRCPELIKLITIKEFDTFPNHRYLLPPEEDPLYTNNLYSMLAGQEWRDYRSFLTPFFTSSKLKVLFELMQQCSIQCLTHFQKHEGRIVVDLLDVFGRYTNDVICTAIFGIACDSLKYPENQFYTMGKTAVSLTPWRSFRPLLNSIAPQLVKIVYPWIKSARIHKFFRAHIMENLRLCQTRRNNRLDLINLLVKARNNNSDVAFDDEDIVVHVFLCYLAGLTTTSAAISFTFYELALNPAIQKKLQLEIDRNLTPTYSCILEMKYLNMVVSETLRKWPSGSFQDRRSIQPFTLEAVTSREKHLHLEAGTEIWIPVFSLHRDPKHYPDPEKFDPERFGDNCIGSTNQSPYLPFGIGPRNCIASRFALLEIKLILYYILSKFNVIPTEKTPRSIVFDPRYLFCFPKGGLWLELQPRNHIFNN